MATIKVEGLYEVDAEALWRHVVRYDTLQQLMNASGPRVELPAGEEQTGDDIAVVFKLWGWLPVGRWHIRVTERNDVLHRLRSEESGGSVRRWAHEVTITALSETRSRHTDTIEIDAGILTPLVAAFARRNYTMRHRERKRMLAAEKG